MSINNEARAAAKWWGNVIKNPKFDMGEPDSVGGMAQMMASMNTTTVSSESVEIFTNELTKIIEREFGKHGRVMLDCDYAPCGLLTEAGDIAGISPNNFPWKTNMAIRPLDVQVSYGYGKPYETIYRG